MKTNQVGQTSQPQHFGQRERLRHARDAKEAYHILCNVTASDSPYPEKYRGRCKKAYKEIWDRPVPAPKPTLKVEPAKTVVQESKDVFLPPHEMPERKPFKKGKPHLHPGRFGNIGAIATSALGALAATAVAR